MLLISTYLKLSIKITLWFLKYIHFLYSNFIAWVFFPSIWQVVATLWLQCTASHCGGFSCLAAQALERAGFSRFTSWALQLWIRNWDSWAQLPLSMWDLWPGNNPHLLHCPVDSLPLTHREGHSFFNTGFIKIGRNLYVIFCLITFNFFWTRIR